MLRVIKILNMSSVYTGIYMTVCNLYSFHRIYIFVAVALDKSIFLDVLHFPMKNIKSCDLEAMPMGGATSKPASDVLCLLLLE